MADITPILMPKWGLSMREGKLAAWHVAEGAEISPGDEIMDVETDKIANVVEAADGGLLRRRVGIEGETYPVRALLAVMAPPSVPEDQIDAYVAAYQTGSLWWMKPMWTSAPRPPSPWLRITPTYWSYKPSLNHGR